jgi:hypothetical protein
VSRLSWVYSITSFNPSAHCCKEKRLQQLDEDGAIGEHAPVDVGIH